MYATDNVVLVGPMGAGKTSIGRQLARKLKRPFWDSDRQLEQRTGVDIPTIFAYEGETGFRKREQRILQELTQKQGIILATGGGAVLDPLNRQRLRSGGYVIYLRVSVETQLKRTAHDRNRPLLESTDPRTRLQTLFNTRDPLYRLVADITVDADHYAIGAIVNRLARRTRELTIQPDQPEDK